MAACYKKELNNKMEVEYTTKVIEQQGYLTDKNVLLKAYLRRGLAYEEMEKYLQAKEDMLSVKQLQHDNKQASQCLNRVNKAIQQVYGDQVPEVQKNAPIKMATEAGNQSKGRQNEKSVEAKKEEPAESDEMDQCCSNSECATPRPDAKLFANRLNCQLFRRAHCFKRKN